MPVGGQTGKTPRHYFTNYGGGEFSGASPLAVASGDTSSAVPGSEPQLVELKTSKQAASVPTRFTRGGGFRRAGRKRRRAGKEKTYTITSPNPADLRRYSRDRCGRFVDLVQLWK